MTHKADHTVFYRLISLRKRHPLTEGDMALLDSEETARYNKFHHVQDREAYAWAHIEMRLALAQFCNTIPTEITYRHEEHGKPILAEKSPNLHFNFSRTKGYALLAVSNNLPVGADIELCKSFPEMDALAQSHFAPTEMALYKHALDSSKSRLFHTIWTRKEAILKAIGCGLHIPPSTFSTFNKNGESELHSNHESFQNIAKAIASPEKWSINSFNPSAAPNLAISIAIPTQKVTLLEF